MRERADLAEIIGQYVTLKSAGGGALKGLCPFHDEKSPSFHVRPGKGFHCLAADTRVMTWDGVRPISELAGGEHRILGADAQWHWAPFKSFGVQRLWRIRVTRNRQVKDIFATDGHRWFVRAGKDRSTRREKVTTSLKPGDALGRCSRSLRLVRVSSLRRALSGLRRLCLRDVPRGAAPQYSNPRWLRRSTVRAGWFSRWRRPTGWRRCSAPRSSRGTPSCWRTTSSRATASGAEKAATSSAS